MDNNIKKIKKIKNSNKSIISLESIIGSGEKAIAVASKVANLLKDIVEKQKLYENIAGKKYVRVDGWVTLGSMLGLFADVIRCDVEKSVKRVFLVKRKIGDRETTLKTTLPLENDEILDIYEKTYIKSIAEVQLKHLKTGNILGKAIAYCTNEEKGKEDFDEFKIASLAQTRATGKAFRLLVSWIMSLAGYEPTPAEEIENLNNQEQVNYGDGELKLIK
ncbi:MAG: hypothetical protein QXR88_02040 [Candidatus Pacearchaeota archaeon]